MAPRATPLSSLGKWIAGGRTAVVVAGDFRLLSSRGGLDEGVIPWRGEGWIIDRDGDTLTLTDRTARFRTVDESMAAADAAKTTFPPYIKAQV